MTGLNQEDFDWMRAMLAGRSPQERARMTETEAHRWPDVIGEPIDPNRGDRLPAEFS